MRKKGAGAPCLSRRCVRPRAGADKGDRAGSGNELYTLHEIEVKPPLGDDAEKGERRRARTSENAELFPLQIGESLYGTGDDVVLQTTVLPQDVTHLFMGNS